LVLDFDISAALEEKPGWGLKRQPVVEGYRMVVGKVVMVVVE
jgi:hypothetical protein